MRASSGRDCGESASDIPASQDSAAWPRNRSLVIKICRQRITRALGRSMRNSSPVARQNLRREQNGPVLGRVALNTIISAVQRGDSGDRNPNARGVHIYEGWVKSQSGLSCSIAADDKTTDDCDDDSEPRFPRLCPDIKITINHNPLRITALSRIESFPLIRPFDHGVREATNSGCVRPGLAAVKSASRHQRGHEASWTPRAILLFARTKVLASRGDAKGTR